MACERLEQNCKLLTESMVCGHPHKGMYRFTKILAVALRGKLRGGDGEHVGRATDEPIGDQQDVGIASWRDRKGPEVVNTDGDTWTFR